MWKLLLFVSAIVLELFYGNPEVQQGWIWPAIMAGSSMLAGILGNRKSQQQQVQEQWGEQNQQSLFDNYTIQDLLTMPEYDPKSLALRNILINNYMDRLNVGEDLWGGYTTQGLSNINQNADYTGQIINNILASRGVRGGAAGWANALAQTNRLKQQSEFLNQIPLAKDQWQQQNLQNVAQFFSSLPVGQRNTGVTQQFGSSAQRGYTHGYGQGTATDPGNMLGGMFGGLASSLALLAATGQLPGLAKGPTTVKSSTPITWNDYLRNLPTTQSGWPNPFKPVLPSTVP